MKLYWVYFKTTDLFGFNSKQKTGIIGLDKGDVSEKFWVQMARENVEIISIELAPDWMNT